MGLDHYATNLTERVLSFNEGYLPGSMVKYNNMNTQLLSMIIERTSGMKISDFSQKYLWNHIGINDVEWCMDDSDNIKAYCCHFTTTENMMKVLQLILHKGVVDGKQIISEKYLNEMFTPNENMTYHNERNIWYGYQAWVYKKNDVIINYLSGIKGQLFIMFPKYNVAISRFGNDMGLALRTTVEPWIDEMYPLFEKFF